MQDTVKHFKLALIVTAIVFPLMIFGGIGAFFYLDSLDISNREKAERASMMGTGIATMGCFLMGPFWILGAAKFGKERREKMGKR